jgi:hypothetical protein
MISLSAASVFIYETSPVLFFLLTGKVKRNFKLVLDKGI